MNFFFALGNFRKLTLFFVAENLLFMLFLGATAFAVQDLDCLECHRDAKLRQMLATGELRALFVDPEEWEKDVHHKKGIKCIECHIGMTPFLHPKEGCRRVACDRCHPIQSEENQLNLHNRFGRMTNRPLPECYDCHTKHAVKTKSDPNFTMNGKKIGKTCCSCHGEMTPQRLITLSPAYLILGHRKCDISEKFDLKVCINCHGDASHGIWIGYPDYCVTCHNSKKRAGFLSAFHSGSSYRDQPFRFLLERVILAFTWALTIGVFVIALFFVVRFHKVRRKRHMI